MEDGNSQSFLGSLIKNLSSAFKEHNNQDHNEDSHKLFGDINSNSNILDGVMNDLDWIENSSSNENQDMMNSMNFHKRILDSEIDTIDKELNLIFKNKDTVEHLITLLKKREKLENQAHQLEVDIHGFQKEG